MIRYNGVQPPSVSSSINTACCHLNCSRPNNFLPPSTARNGLPRCPDTLLDITARKVAETEPFQRIEERYDRIPEPVQRRIIFWSFPRNERDICMYSSLSRVSLLNSGDSQSLSFCKGLKLLESGCVESVLQVGFHLSGTVWTYPPNTNDVSSGGQSTTTSQQSNGNIIGHPQQQPQHHQQAIRLPVDRDGSSHNGAGGGAAGGVSYSMEENKKYKVSVSFDRCKITSVTCSCDTKDIFWCHHVVALSLYRIRYAETVKLRVPISETLLQMNRQQLQKFVQYLISAHHTEVLPTAQQLADEILQQKSEINAICGAPDPTAGASTDDDHSWHLDEAQVCEAVKSYLGSGSYYNGNKQLNSLFAKVREMLRAQDSNGARMLTLITEQFLNDPRLLLWKSHGTPMTEKCRQLWDQLGALWVCIVLNPRATQSEKMHWKALLEKWSRSEVCPQEDPDLRPPGRENYRERSHRERERDRNRFFRENNLRNMIYQYQQNMQNDQQQQPPNRNDNDENTDSSESDMDSDVDMDENNEIEGVVVNGEENVNANGINDENLNLPPNDNNSVNNGGDEDDEEPRRHHKSILKRIDYIDRGNDILGDDLGRNRSDDDADNRPEDPIDHIDGNSNDQCFDDNSRGNFDLAIPGCSGINVDIPPPDNDESSRESMDVDDIPDATLRKFELNLGEIDNKPPRSPQAGGSRDLDVNFFADVYMSDTANDTNCPSNVKGCKCQSFESKDTNDAICEKEKKDSTAESSADETHEGDEKIDEFLPECPNPEARKSCDKMDECSPHKIPTDFIVTTTESKCTGKCANTTRHEDDATTTKSIGEKCDYCKKQEALLAKNCECIMNRLDHVNGHSSKMVIELSKIGCDKCKGQPVDEPHKVLPEEDKVEEKRDVQVPINGDVAANAAQGRGIIRGREEGEVRPNKKLKLNNGSAANRNKVPRTIFHKALDAVSMSWDNQHLKNILASDTYSLSSTNSVQIAGSSKSAQANSTSAKSNFNALGQPLWHEPLAMCAARVDSLRSHGHTEAALRLSVSVVRTMKQVQMDAQSLWHKHQQFLQQQQQKMLQAGAAEEASKVPCCCNCTDRKGGKPMSQGIPPSGMYPKAPRENYVMCRYDYIGRNNIPVQGCKRCLYSRSAYEGKHCDYDGKMRGHFEGGMGEKPIVGPFHMFQQQHPNIPDGMSRNNFMGGNRFVGNNYCHSWNSLLPMSSCHADACGTQRQQPDAYGSRQFFHKYDDEMRMRKGPLGGRMPEIDPKWKGKCKCIEHNDLRGRDLDMPPFVDVEVRHNFRGVDRAPDGHQQPPPPPQRMMGCAEHQKNECCIKNFCCKMAQAGKITMKSSAAVASCRTCIMEHSLLNNKCDCRNVTRHNSNFPFPYRHPADVTPQSTGNLFFGRQFQPPVDTHHHHHHPQHQLDASHHHHHPMCGPPQPMYPGGSHGCSDFKCGANIHKSHALGKVNPQNIVNYGASTSKHVPSATATSGSSSSAVNNTVPPPPSTSSQPPVGLLTDVVRNKKATCVSNCLDCTIGCEVEFPLDAVACIFDCLTEACIIPDRNHGPDMGRLTFDSINAAAEDGSILSPQYQHIYVPNATDKYETYLTLAFESAVLALGKQRIMPQGLYSQHVICKQQDQLIARLQHIDLDRLLVEILKNCAIQMMDGGPTSGFGVTIHPESVPMHTLARFLFTSLLNYYPDLAFQVGLRAMRLPVLEDTEGGNEGNADAENRRDGFVLSRYPRWWTLGHLETQQCSLSSAMLSAAKAEPARLAGVLESARRNIHSSSHLFKLAQDAFRYATTDASSRSQILLGVAFELGLQVMRMTLTCLNWRRREMVRWLVTCATHLGLDALISIMQNWYQLFTPTEATGPVATTIMSHSTIMRLNLNLRQQEELSSCARTLALQCATKDPPNCALNALTLTENDPMAFEAAYQIVIDAASHIMTSSQLFTIARYMEHRGYPMRSYKLGILAMKNVHLAYNQDTHPAINDIHWACALSHSLGKGELANMIPLVIKNVQCATVLSDILRRCSVPTPGITHFNSHHRGNNMRPVQKLSYDRAPLRQLLEAAVAAYVNTTHSRLSHISPRHYGDFIDFLSKARDTFILARDGPAHFSRLIENITVAYKGKKKLVRQVRQRFQFV
uniref:SWIM-type domain-containing protein n=1 Tax=Nyssomyia neivai TaxID=330878 RepID=A0A1L8DB63_9DIPT